MCPDFFRQNVQDIAQMREKMRQPKMSTFYCFFGHFRVGLLFENFEVFIFLKNKLDFTT